MTRDKAINDSSRSPGLLPALPWRRVLCLALFVVLAGCTMVKPPAGPEPGRTRLTAPLVMLPGKLVGNHLVIETKGDRQGPARFLVDTGSSVTLISPEYAKRLGMRPAQSRRPAIRVRAASGGYTTLPSVNLRRLDVGDARFENVQVLLYDCADISAHLGLQIDGILGFPLFQDTVFTLDYPRERLLITPVGEPSLVPGSSFTFSPNNRVPLIPVQLDDRTLLVLIDSGSDGPLNLNPVGLPLTFASSARQGASVSTLAGDRTQQVGRLAATLHIGNYRLPQPVVDLTDQLSSLGGDVLKHFTLTFDQRRGNVTFYRETPAPVVTPPRRSAGMSFARTPAYWRVTSVVPDSPADSAGIVPGDLVTRINGELVERWDLIRFQALLRDANWIEFTFLHGREETTGRISLFELVP